MHKAAAVVAEEEEAKNTNNSEPVAPPNPNKYATYGGLVKESGKYNIEMVFQPMLKQNPLAFYLMDKKGKPVSNKDITGEVKTIKNLNIVETLQLSPVAENEFAGQLQNKTGSATFNLTLKVKGKDVVASFESDTATKM